MSIQLLTEFLVYGDPVVAPINAGWAADDVDFRFDFTNPETANRINQYITAICARPYMDANAALMRLWSKLHSVGIIFDIKQVNFNNPAGHFEVPAQRWGGAHGMDPDGTIASLDAFEDGHLYNIVVDYARVRGLIQLSVQLVDCGTKKGAVVAVGVSAEHKYKKKLADGRQIGYLVDTIGKNVTIEVWDDVNRSIDKMIHFSDEEALKAAEVIAQEFIDSKTTAVAKDYVKALHESSNELAEWKNYLTTHGFTEVEEGAIALGDVHWFQDSSGRKVRISQRANVDGSKETQFVVGNDNKWAESVKGSTLKGLIQALNGPLMELSLSGILKSIAYPIVMNPRTMKTAYFGKGLPAEAVSKGMVYVDIDRDKKMTIWVPATKFAYEAAFLMVKNNQPKKVTITVPGKAQPMQFGSYADALDFLEPFTNPTGAFTDYFSKAIDQYRHTSES